MPLEISNYFYLFNFSAGKSSEIWLLCFISGSRNRPQPICGNEAIHKKIENKQAPFGIQVFIGGDPSQSNYAQPAGCCGGRGDNHLVHV
jgi:hypothetical protein